MNAPDVAHKAEDKQLKTQHRWFSRFAYELSMRTTQVASCPAIGICCISIKIRLKQPIHTRVS
jgi:hypothetical protein